MTSKHDETFDTNKAALILVYGNAAKRHWPLDQNAVVIGRGRGCDLGLDAADISSIHCVIARRPEGYYLRDCHSRSGTRLNGNKIYEQLLTDGDLLQLGPFSFRVHLPRDFPRTRSAADERFLARLQRSRKNLIRLALRQRQRLQHQGEAPSNFQSEASALCERVREYEQRLRLLEEGERDLSRDRELLGEEQRLLQKQVRQFDEEMAERRAALEAETAERQPVETTADRAAWEQQRRCLAEERDRLLQWREELLQRSEEWQTEYQRIQQMHEQWLTTQAEVRTRLERQHAALLETEEALRAQRVGLATTIADLERLTPAESSSPPENRLRQENEQLRQVLEQRQAELGNLRQDQELLLKTLQEYEQRRHQEGKHAAQEQTRRECSGAQEEQSQALQNEVDLLRQLLKEKDAVLLQVQQQKAVSAGSHQQDIEVYEEELNQYRRQLDADRAKLNQELQLLRDRNAEMDEATRELELEMARERAEMARERSRMERMRDEIRLEMERMNRDTGVRERLAPVQKLRDQMNERKQGGTPVAPTDESAAEARLRSQRRLTDHGKG